MDYTGGLPPVPRDLRTRVPFVSVAAVLAHPRAKVIDVRSPSEFAEDHVPGAVNLPLFDDVERAVVGLLYHRSSPQTAFDKGLEVVRENVVALAESIAALGGVSIDRAAVLARTEELCAGGLPELSGRVEPTPTDEAPEAPLVLHCWRGGLRSCSVIALMRQLGLDQAVGMTGGYKAYRAHVRATLATAPVPPSIVLRGLTGVGKTLVLREVERLRPGTTLDLEGLAGHRSSLLGMVGLEPVSQKAFDTGLATRLTQGFEGPMIVEGESRKVGDVTVSPRVWSSMQAGTNLLLEADVPRRVEVLLEDYLAQPSARAQLRTQLEAVQRRLKVKSVDLLALFDAGSEPELVEVLLEHYYDPLYLHSEKGKQYAARIDASDATAAAEAVLEFLGAAQ